MWTTKYCLIYWQRAVGWLRPRPSRSARTGRVLPGQDRESLLGAELNTGRGDMPEPGFAVCGSDVQGWLQSFNLRHTCRPQSTASPEPSPARTDGVRDPSVLSKQAGYRNPHKQSNYKLVEVNSLCFRARQKWVWFQNPLLTTWLILDKIRDPWIPL